MAGNNDEVYDLLLLVGLWSHFNEPERLEVNLRQLIEPIVTWLGTKPTYFQLKFEFETWK